MATDNVELAKSLRDAADFITGDNDEFIDPAYLASVAEDMRRAADVLDPASAGPQPLCRRCGLPEGDTHEFGFRDHVFRAPDDCLPCDGRGWIFDHAKGESHQCKDCEGSGKAVVAK